MPFLAKCMKTQLMILSWLNFNAYPGLHNAHIYYLLYTFIYLLLHLVFYLFIIYYIHIPSDYTMKIRARVEPAPTSAPIWMDGALIQIAISISVHKQQLERK